MPGRLCSGRANGPIGKTTLVRVGLASSVKRHSLHLLKLFGWLRLSSPCRWSRRAWENMLFSDEVDSDEGAFMRDHSHHIELSRDEAVEQMLSALAKEGFG